VTFPTITQSKPFTSDTVTSTTNTVALTAAAAGALLVYCLAGDKNTGALTMTDNVGTAGGANPWTVELALTSASVSLYVARKVAVGGETSIVGTTATGPATGNTGWVAELAETGAGAWAVTATASAITTEASVTTCSTPATAAATYDGLALAVMAVDTAGNVPGGSWTGGSWTPAYDAPTTSGTGGGAGGIHVATAQLAKDATISATWTNTGGTADQQSVAVVAFGRAAAAPTGPPARTRGFLSLL
jgi:hypothetical protein